MVEEDKKSSPLVEEFDSKNRKGSNLKDSEKFSSAGGLADSKKLDDLKKTDENKEAIAEAEGKNSEVGKKKEASKPAVTKVDNKKGKDKKDVVELEREYVVPMRKGFMNVPHYRRAKKAVKTLKEFMVRHMNIRDGDLRKVKVDISLNNEIWFRGIRKPLNKIKVRAVKKDGIVTVTLSDPADYVKFKMAREAKRKLAMAAPEKAGKVKEEKVVDADKDKDGVDDKKEESEDREAGTEKAVKSAKVEANVEKHTAQGKHLKKTAPVRKALKK